MKFFGIMLFIMIGVFAGYSGNEMLWTHRMISQEGINAGAGNPAIILFGFSVLLIAVMCGVYFVLEHYEERKRKEEQQKQDQINEAYQREYWKRQAVDEITRS